MDDFVGERWIVFLLNDFDLFFLDGIGIEAFRGFESC